jgi:hypothetical protein
VENLIVLISLFIGATAGIISILADSEQLVHTWSAWRRRRAAIKHRRDTMLVPSSPPVSRESSASEGNPDSPGVVDQEILSHEGEQESLLR